MNILNEVQQMLIIGLFTVYHQDLPQFLSLTCTGYTLHHFQSGVQYILPPFESISRPLGTQNNPVSIFMEISAGHAPI